MSSNLCTEIMEFSDANEIAVCNLASLCLPRYVIEVNGKLEPDYMKLYQVTRTIARNLDNIIDINYYAYDIMGVSKTKRSNSLHRPFGIGVQGLADLFMLCRAPFESKEASIINKKVFETIYFAAMTESNELAKEFGSYESYAGSPISKGLFQFDLWNMDESNLSGMWDWEALRQSILKYGVRNSLTTTCMPTASTSQIMGNNECIEPYTENIYTRSTLAGDYYVVNKHLVTDLEKLNMWNEDIVDQIKYFAGSVKNIPGIPDNIKEIYRTAWEISPATIIQMSADRAPFVDQSQSLNIFMDKPSYEKISTVHFMGWKLGLKTGMYYLRTNTPKPQQFGIDIDKIKQFDAMFNRSTDLSEKEEDDSEPIMCVRRPSGLGDGEHCIVCTS